MNLKGLRLGGTELVIIIRVVFTQKAIWPMEGVFKKGRGSVP